ncbi:DegV family EDD domain-containing protein [Mycoplasma miroungigenitalium]|uniref:DegV family EDD domain-containing protein n=1 Tax=Mycoplasma miroungigenitalium TaxID=754515 RepID=A0A6M4JAZ0_9MOLU|nr:DegV family protein [Mycoplasma miroungigenitalium]QJR43555.1 DegV family EDD domain-containing protein [Mycoplasma miroungigenitalium]
MKYAIVVDSSSALTKNQTDKLGWYYLPLHISINGKEYRDGIDINGSNLFEFYGTKEEAKTSAINLGVAEELLTKLSNEFDKVLVYPISKNLSGTCNSLTTLSRDFENVRVVQSIQVLQMITIDLAWFEYQMSKDSSKFDEYVDMMENGWYTKAITLIPKYNQYLVKGGRLHPTAASVARLFKIVPMICWEEGFLKKEAVGRSFFKTCLKAVERKQTMLPIEAGKELFTMALHSMAKDPELTDFVNNITETLGVKPVVDLIGPVVSIHTGPEALAVLAFVLEPEIIKIIKEKFEIIKEVA